MAERPYQRSKSVDGKPYINNFNYNEVIVGTDNNVEAAIRKFKQLHNVVSKKVRQNSYYLRPGLRAMEKSKAATQLKKRYR